MAHSKYLSLVHGVTDQSAMGTSPEIQPRASEERKELSKSETLISNHTYVCTYFEYTEMSDTRGNETVHKNKCACANENDCIQPNGNGIF